MFAVLLCALAFSQKEIANSPWPNAMERIAKHMAGFRVSASREVNARRFKEVIRKAGLPIWEGPNEKGNERPGYYLDWYDDVVPVRGTGDTIVRISRSGGPDKYQGTFTTYIEHTSKGMGFAIFDPDPAFEGPQIESTAVFHAARSGYLLLTSGTVCWKTGSPKPSLILWRWRKGAWRPISQKLTFIESNESPRVVSTGRGQFSIEPLRGRFYPDNLDTCHATSQQTWTQRVELRGTRFITVSMHLDMTPYNQVDKLYGALVKGDKRAVRALCLGSHIANEVMALRPRTSEPVAEVDFPTNVSDPMSRRIAVWNLRTWFHFTKRNEKWVVAKLTPYTGRTE